MNINKSRNNFPGNSFNYKVDSNKHNVLQRYPGLFETPRNLKLPILDDFRPRITMGNPIVTEILGFSDVGFSKNEKFSAKKSKK